MVKNIIRIDDMICSMYEAHMSDAIRKQFPDAGKAVTSHGKKEASFITEEPAGETIIKKIIGEASCRHGGFCTEPYGKKGLFDLSG